MKFDIWDVFFHVGMFVVAVWTILKSLGIINTPVWLELGVPVVGVMLSVYSFYTKLSDELSDVRSDVAALKSSMSHVEQDLHLIKQKLMSN